jgi:hypothetical protein
MLDGVHTIARPFDHVAGFGRLLRRNQCSIRRVVNRRAGAPLLCSLALWFVEVYPAAVKINPIPRQPKDGPAPSGRVQCKQDEQANVVSLQASYQLVGFLPGKPTVSRLPAWRQFDLWGTRTKAPTQGRPQRLYYTLIAPGSGAAGDGRNQLRWGCCRDDGQARCAPIVGARLPASLGQRDPQGNHSARRLQRKRGRLPAGLPPRCSRLTTAQLSCGPSRPC